MERIKISIIALVFAVSFSCSNQGSVSNKLPKLGRYEIVVNEETNTTDTLWHKIGDFKFIDQTGSITSQEDFKNKIYVTDFFFTSCPDICPKMKTQMIRVYDKFKSNPNIMFLSHTIDPRNDTVEVLREFSERIDADPSIWKFVTGDKEEIYRVGQTSYMASMADEGDGGFTHSGRFFLIDTDKHVRGAYDGTDPISVDKMMKDIELLIDEQFGETR